jgi:cysteine desulfurase/selenocysteine lyase
MRASIEALPSRPAVQFDPERARADFPILRQKIHGRPLVYLDNAATSQKPQRVIDAISNFYSTTNANVHRGVHALSERATEQFELAREKVRAFINAPRVEDIVFVRGTTEAINLVAQSFGRSRLRRGDEILISAMEHHSNIVPWQLLCESTGAVLRVAPINDDGELVVGEFEALLGPKTRLVALAHVSNALGTINPVRQLVAAAHSRGVPVLLDGAQAIPHLKVDVKALDCDFYVFSSHKMFGPMGIGALFGKADLLESMPPYQGGGDMILSVTFEKTVYNRVPYKFEAGTPDVGGAVGLGSAIDYLNSLGMEQIAAYEHDLLDYATGAIAGVPGVKLVGTAQQKAGVISFLLKDIHPHDIGTILDQEGIAIRTGHHCAQPVMQRFGVDATARASLAFYNTREDIDRLVAGLDKVKEIFQ